MALKFFKKKFSKRRINVINNISSIIDIIDSNEEVKTTSDKKNKKNKNKETMNTIDKIKEAEMVLSAMEPEVKVIKTDKGLIERTESSKIILTEDNRQILND